METGRCIRPTCLRPPTVSPTVCTRSPNAVASPVCLGGDHYIEYPSCLGFCRAVEEKDPDVKVGYVHIDGHLDFSLLVEGPARYNNGTNARLTSELTPISLPNMVWIGIQGPCDLGQVRDIRSMGGTIFTSEDIRRLGPAEVGRQAGEWASKGCDYYYLTLDIDVIDAGLSPGTGSVTMGAVPPYDLMVILEELSKFPIGAMDINEVTPPMGRGATQPALCHRRFHSLLASTFIQSRATVTGLDRAGG